MKCTKIQLLLLLILLLPLVGWGQQKSILLNYGWTFNEMSTNQWFPAMVPGSLVTDLMKLDKISDPFIGDNESKSQWIAEKSWCYKTSFEVDKVDFEKFSRAELVFLGIDTYASIYINDSLIYQSDNMFIPHKIEVKKRLKIGENELRVVFPPVIPILKEKAKQLPYLLPENERVFARKAQFQFGWDWAPKVLAPSIFNSVYLTFWDNVKVNSPAIISTLNGNNGAVVCKIPISKTNTKITDLLVKVTDERSRQICFQRVFRVNGDTLIECGFDVINPKIWNPSGIGEPNLYHYKITVTSARGEKYEFTKQVGFRNVTLVQTPDSLGSSFYFKVNGEPVFAKGANWIPMEYLPHLNTVEKYRKLLNLVHDAGYNMLRVWGGGWYEDDVFYNLCDSLGIMVWQDAMFACSMYPSDENFLKNVSHEIEYQSNRLSSHPSLVLWCGNNENYEGWFNWGWQTQFNYSADDSTAIWNGNRKLFESVIPNALQKTYGNIEFNYHPSSPANGWGRDTAYKSGDVHYWGVWWGMEPFSNFRKKVGRFVSEYGFQGYPSIETLRYGANQQIDSLSQPTVAAHQKHPRGYATIEEYLLRDYPKPTNVEDYIYLSQLMQADGVGEALKSHTQQVPYCMGSLFWQFNDCWSSVSWSAVDYLNHPKQFYFASKRLFKSVKPTFVIHGDIAEVWVANIGNSVFKGALVLTEIDLLGANKKTETFSVNIASNKSLKITSADNIASKPNSVFQALLLDSLNNIVTEELFFGTQPKNLKLKKPTISFHSISQTTNSTKFIVSSDVPVKGLWLTIDGFELSDNGFDLFPGRGYEVICTSITPQAVFSIKKIKTISLNDMLNR